MSSRRGFASVFRISACRIVISSMGATSTYSQMRMSAERHDRRAWDAGPRRRGGASLGPPAWSVTRLHAGSERVTTRGRGPAGSPRRHQRDPGSGRRGIARDPRVAHPRARTWRGADRSPDRRHRFCLRVAEGRRRAGPGATRRSAARSRGQSPPVAAIQSATRSHAASMSPSDVSSSSTGRIDSEASRRSRSCSRRNASEVVVLRRVARHEEALGPRGLPRALAARAQDEVHVERPQPLLERTEVEVDARARPAGTPAPRGGTGR